MKNTQHIYQDVALEVSGYGVDTHIKISVKINAIKTRYNPIASVYDVGYKFNG